MQYLGYVLAVAGTLAGLTAAADPNPARIGSPELAPAIAPAAAVTWPVQGSLKTTLRAWAQRQGWPAPQFLTDADWAVDVPGTVNGSIDEALKALAGGFAQSPSRPRIEVTGNHVILVSEVGAE